MDETSGRVLGGFGREGGLARWHAVYAKHRSEFQAAWNLRNAGYRVFYPHYLGTVSHGRRLIGVPKPLLPRYLFAQTTVFAPDLDGMWRSVGVLGVVPVDHRDRPMPVDDDVILALMARADPSGLMSLSSGERERCEAVAGRGQHFGSLACFVRALSEIAEDERIRIWVRAFGRRHRVAMPGALGGSHGAPVLRTP